MTRFVTTLANFVSVPYESSVNGGMNSRLINSSGTTVELTEDEYRAISPTAFDEILAESPLGRHVSRATDTLPASTTEAIFTITGGRVKITGIAGEVTTVIQTQANATKLQFDPSDAGATQDLCATLDITADAVGTMYSITGVASEAMRDGLNFLDAADNMQDQGVILKPGSILLNCAATNTGSVKWDLWYIPLDDGATVAAA